MDPDSSMFPLDDLHVHHKAVYELEQRSDSSDSSRPPVTSTRCAVAITLYHDFGANLDGLKLFLYARHYIKCLVFRRKNEVIPKIVYFRYLKNNFLDQSIQKNILI